MNHYLKDPISNGNKYEQALIRRWWHEEHNAKGRLVWEYCLKGKYQDAIWFPNAPVSAEEKPGQKTKDRYPLENQEVVLCEAKLDLTPELIGQALVYKVFAQDLGAIIKNCVIFSKTANEEMIKAAKVLNLIPVVGSESLPNDLS